MNWTTALWRVASFAFAVAFLLCALWHDLSLPWLYWGLWQVAGVVACNLYKQLLTNRLGRQGVQRYMNSRPLRWLAVLATFQFEAFACFLVMRSPG